MKYTALMIVFNLIIFGCSQVFSAGHPDHWSDYQSTDNAGQSSLFSWTFDNTKTGKLPFGWQAQGTNQQGPVATWTVKADDSRPSGSKVLALTNAHEGHGSTFNLCWTDRLEFGDGAINVKIKRDSGSIDQGGGIVWRVQNQDNYYVVRWNPLEDNFRFYCVVDGERKQLASAQVKADPEKWHSMRIEQMGAEIKCFFDDIMLMNLRDSTFPAPGGAGVWTKADATTAFDNFEVRGWSSSHSQKDDAP